MTGVPDLRLHFRVKLKFQYELGQVKADHVGYDFRKCIRGSTSIKKAFAKPKRNQLLARFGHVQIVEFVQELQLGMPKVAQHSIFGNLMNGERVAAHPRGTIQVTKAASEVLHLAKQK